MITEYNKNSLVKKIASKLTSAKVSNVKRKSQAESFDEENARSISNDSYRRTLLTNVGSFIESHSDAAIDYLMGMIEDWDSGSLRSLREELGIPKSSDIGSFFDSNPKVAVDYLMKIIKGWNEESLHKLQEDLQEQY